MNQVFNIYKPIGKTPLQMIENFKLKFPEYSNTSITYAGRLDPLAEGVLLLIVNPTQVFKDSITKFDKTYVAETLFGFSTDTLDLMGLVDGTTTKTLSPVEIRKETKNFIGTTKLPYPIYSSKTVRGKPLFFWAQNKLIDSITVPIATTKIYSFGFFGLTQINHNQLRSQLSTIIEVRGDFRQAKIVQKWDKVLTNLAQKKNCKLQNLRSIVLQAHTLGL